MNEPVRVGVVGLGYWGPNLARNFDRLPGAALRWICDADEEKRARWAPQFPATQASGDFDELLADPDLDAVVIATHVPSHPALAQRAFEAGKHVFVEKPLAQSVAEAEQVVAAAERAGRVLMVGHLLEYHPGVERLKQIADSGELGADIAYHDEHVPALPQFGLENEPFDRAVGDADAAVIVTAHPGVDWQAVADRAALVIDFRGVTRGIKADNLIRL